ncbi:uncharacterized protein [Anas acuta]|uniref:uncharacterized protein isoform X4 n=1 Tax=Anas acuta TaxID=28680 RepID=UPI0035C8A521
MALTTVYTDLELPPGPRGIPQLPKPPGRWWYWVIMGTGWVGAAVLAGIVVWLLQRHGAKGCWLCPAGWQPFATKCYWVSAKTLSWEEAGGDCKDRRAELVVLKSMEEKAAGDGGKEGECLCGDIEGEALLPLVQHAVALDLPERGHQDLSTASTEGATTRHKRDGTRHQDAKKQHQSFEAGGFSQLCFVPPLSLSPPTSESCKQGHQALKLQSAGQMFFPNLLDISKSLCNCCKDTSG